MALNLRTGSNVFVVLLGRQGVPASNVDRIKLVAENLGAILKSKVEYVGKEPTQLASSHVFVIGDARPVHIWSIGPNARLAKFNADYGAPVGLNPYYFSVSLDWRGVSQSFSMAGNVAIAIPKSAAPVTGESSWPDGDASAQKARIKKAEVDATLSEIAAKAQDSAALAKSLASEITPLLIAAGAAAFGAWLLLGRFKR